jgi:succinate dehydrogenase / fumarate reductase flavoprotein subunit
MEYLESDGEAKRDDENFAYVAAWEYSEDGAILNKEQLDFEFVKPSVRDYT